MARLTQIRANVVSLVDRAAVRDPSNPTEPQRFLLWKSELGGHTTTEGGTVPTIDELTADLAKAEQDKNDALAKAEAAEAKVAELEKAAEPAEPTADDLSKADLPEGVKTLLAKQEAEVAELRKSAQEATDLAKAEKDARVTNEFVNLAKSDYPHVGGTPETFGPILKAASERLSKDQFEGLTTQLKAAEAQVARGDLFKSQGRDGVPVPEATDALQKAETRAEELRKADPSLGLADSMRQAMRENADAYRAETAAA